MPDQFALKLPGFHNLSMVIPSGGTSLYFVTGAYLDPEVGRWAGNPPAGR